MSSTETHAEPPSSTYTLQPVLTTSKPARVDGVSDVPELPNPMLSPSSPSPPLPSDHESLTTGKTALLKRLAVVLHLAGLNLTTSAANGLVVISLPVITRALQLPPSLAFWPTSVTSLATASTLLLAGAVSDATSPRAVQLFGALLTGAHMLACGLARTSVQLVALRALQGVGTALHCAASIALITAAVPAGRARNLAFATWGLSQPLGFSLGLVLGGVIVDRAGWRAGWFVFGGLTLALMALGTWALPGGVNGVRRGAMWERLRKRVDWVGAAFASATMTFASYLCAILSTDIYRIKDADAISFLVLSVACLAGFVGWMHYRVKKGLPALIPNSLWRNVTFSSICATLTLSFAVITCLELFASLFFQEIQHLSEVQAAVRILPSMLVAILLNFTMGLIVNRIPPTAIVIASSLLAAISPLLMALIPVHQTYWANAFVAQLLQPVSCDCLITVGLLVVTEIFPPEQHSLAGAVFNTTYQFGTALGLAVMQIVSTLETRRWEARGRGREDALMKGYRASFWTMFGFMIACAVVGGWGLRKTGKIGVKRE